MKLLQKISLSAKTYLQEGSYRPPLPFVIDRWLRSWHTNPKPQHIAVKAFAIGAPSDTVRELTGKDAEDFETVARRHAALPESRQRLRVRLAVLARLLKVPILPGSNPETYDRAQEQPMPPTPHLALDDAGWAASHGIEDLVVEGGTLKEALA